MRPIETSVLDIIHLLTRVMYAIYMFV